MKVKKSLISLVLALTLCSCNKEISGSWKTIMAPTFIKAVTSVSSTGQKYYGSASPFNTSMSLNYFFNSKNSEETNNNLYNEITTMYSDEVVRLHKYYDRHMYYEDENGDLINNIKVINDSYGTGKEIVCSPELYSLLKNSVEAYKLTDGMFNIFTGAISDYWDNIFTAYSNGVDVTEIDPYFNNERKTILESLVSRVPNDIDSFNAQLTFNDDNMSVVFNQINFDSNEKDVYRPIISVGGIGKGLATDYVKEKLVNANYKEGILLSGGSTISSLAKPIYSSKVKGQKIVINNPIKSNYFQKVPAFSFQISEEFNLSTSANDSISKNYWFVDSNISNQMYFRHHIINPKTGYPESYHRSITIFSYNLSNGLLDALSTAFMNLSIEDGKKLREKVLNTYPNSSLEILYLIQNGYGENASVSVYATSTINDTLVVEEGVVIDYEK